MTLLSERLPRLAPPPGDPAAMSLNFEVAERGGDQVIAEYDGSVLLVSHDRAFLREVATRVWWFDGTHVRDFDGPVVEWEETQADRVARS